MLAGCPSPHAPTNSAHFSSGCTPPKFLNIADHAIARSINAPSVVGKLHTVL